MIDVTGIQFRHPGQAAEAGLVVDTLQVAAGAGLAITGPSGAGKTTLLHVLTGNLLPQQGRVSIGQFVLTDQTDGERRRFRLQHMGLVFQAFELFDYLSVLDNILLPYRLSGDLHLDDAVHARARTLASRLGLQAAVRRRIATLSQGERQRVAVCRALLHKPAYVFCDEPTANLDAGNAALVMDVLLEYQRAETACLVMVTHAADALSRFDQVYALSGSSLSLPSPSTSTTVSDPEDR